jgi:hypothetical protein
MGTWGHGDRLNENRDRLKFTKLNRLTLLDFTRKIICNLLCTNKLHDVF